MTKNSFFIKMIPLWLFIVLFRIAGTVHYSIISPYGEKLFPLWLVGILMGGVAFIQLILDVPTGWLIDKFGSLKFLKIGTITFTVATLLLFLDLTKTTFLLSIILSSVGWMFYGPSISAYILSKTPVNMTGRYLSFSDTFASLGVFVGSALLIVLITSDIPYVAKIMTLFFFASLVAIFYLPKEKLPKQKATHGLKSRHHRIQFKIGKKTIEALKELNPPAMMLMIHGFAGSMFYSIIWFVLPLIMIHRENGSLIEGLGLGIFDFAIFVVGISLGNLVDRFDKVRMAFIGLMIFAISALVIGFNFSWLFLLFGFLAATGDELSHLSLWAWLNKLKKKNDSEIDYGTISGAVTLFQDLGWALGPMLAGLIYIPLGGSMTIAIGGGFILISWIIYQIVVFKNKKA